MNERSRPSFWARIRRTRVVRVVIVYLAAAWLLLQVTSLFIESFDLPAWFFPAALLLLLIGLVIVVATEWVQSHPLAASRAARDDIPTPWEIDLGDATASVKRGRLPHLTWARALLGGVAAFVLLFGVAGAYVLLRESGNPERSARRDAAPATAIQSIAVLPFVNMSADEENEYFADGLTEDVITHLSKIGGLRVISRTSVMRYKDSRKSGREIGRELGVAKLIEGTVRRTPDRVRITAQLVDASTDQHVWAETYDRQMSDIFLIQSDIARQIATALEAEVSPAERKRLERAPTRNLAAYDYYLRGREHYRRFTKDDNERAIEFFRQALSVDPDFALAHAGLSISYAQGVFVYALQEVWSDTALESAQKAVTLDPQLAEARYALGLAYEVNGRLRDAARELQRAIDLNPNHAASISDLGWTNLHLGRLSAALTLARKAVLLDPGFTDYRWLMGEIYIWLEDFDQAMKWTTHTLQVQPDHPYARYNLVWLHLARGELEIARKVAEQALSVAPDVPASHLAAGDAALLSHDLREAEVHLKRAVELSPSRSHFAVPHLAYIYFATGRAEEAEKVLQPRIREATSRVAAGDDGSHLAYELAALEAVRANTTEAYRWLEEGIRRAPGFWFLADDMANKDPVWQSLRGEERFQRLMRDYHAAVEKQRREVRNSVAPGAS